MCDQSKKSYRSNRIIAQPNSGVLYYLANPGLERSIVAEELMVIRGAVEIPPGYEKEW